MAHIHFLIWAATDKVEDKFMGITYVDVIADSLDDAIKRAKKLCPGKRHYWINNITEHHDHEK